MNKMKAEVEEKTALMEALRTRLDEKDILLDATRARLDRLNPYYTSSYTRVSAENTENGTQSPVERLNHLKKLLAQSEAMADALRKGDK